MCASLLGLCCAWHVQSASLGCVVRSPSWAMAERSLALDGKQMLEGCWHGMWDVLDLYVTKGAGTMVA